jgi:hypothetical protein
MPGQPRPEMHLKQLKQLLLCFHIGIGDDRRQRCTGRHAVQKSGQSLRFIRFRACRRGFIFTRRMARHLFAHSIQIDFFICRQIVQHHADCFRVTAAKNR